MEEKVAFTVDGLCLSGLYKKHRSEFGAVITHPHPVYGGDMVNPVVESITHAFNREGVTTLRFNFRGVGKSEGKHDDGKGEQHDIMGALDFLIEQGISKVCLAGYSFGAWVMARMEYLPPEVTAQLLVAPPVALLDYSNIKSMPRLRLVISGEEDEIAPPNLIEESLLSWNASAKFEMIDYADHFFYGFFPDLEKRVRAFVKNSFIKHVP